MSLDDLARRWVERDEDRIEELRQLSWDHLMAWHGPNWEPDDA